jgi:Putative adhesin
MVTATVPVTLSWAPVSVKGRKMRGGERRLVSQPRTIWAWLVTMSACAVLGAGLAMAVWWVVSSERRVTSYSVRGVLTAVALDLDSADAEIVGGREDLVVEVRRTDRFAFGHAATHRREAAGGVLRISSRCPRTVFGSCAAAYRVTVPNNVPVSVRTGSGDVRLSGFRGSARIATASGEIAASSFCGFLLHARAGSGDVSATAACAPERLELRSETGEVRAVVPPGRYRIDADSDDGARSVRGLRAADDAPFHILALSGAGDVAVEAGP